jgi:hypothetical protein
MNKSTVQSVVDFEVKANQLLVEEKLLGVDRKKWNQRQAIKRGSIEHKSQKMPLPMLLNKRRHEKEIDAQLLQHVRDL